jgi:hypothetical protein
VSQDLALRIEKLLALPPYKIPPEERGTVILSLLKDELDDACQRNERVRNYIEHWPIPFREAECIADLPYLPVGVFKANPPLSLVEAGEIKRTLTSSTTTGQTPSRIVLDSATARRMTRGVIAIAQDFIGPTRRPYLIVDVQQSVGRGEELGARGAAIQGLESFAREVAYCLTLGEQGTLRLDKTRLEQFAEDHRGKSVLVYGFTYILWNYLVTPLREEGLCLNMPNVHVLHSGGWKRLQEQAVGKEAFNEGVAAVLGCSPDRVIDFYGLVENVGVIYPDCSAGNKHVPVFGEVIVRNPLTLRQVGPKEDGILQVCSVLPTSFPGYLLLTEDMAHVVSYDGCPCGRQGISFRFLHRVPKSEVRGCGNVSDHR